MNRENNKSIDRYDYYKAQVDGAKELEFNKKTEMKNLSNIRQNWFGLPIAFTLTLIAYMILR